MNPQPSGFHGLGIAPSILTILDKAGFTVPTPIQEQSIPQAIEGKDVIGVAQTGTGKTYAFGIPAIQTILKNPRWRALVLLPTRDLALQVEESLRKITGPLGIKTVVIVGGDSMGRQVRDLQRHPQIILATPGRLIDHLQQKTMTLADVRIAVLDEADRMLDMGFAPQLKRILPLLPTERQTMLFSATMPESIVGMARAYMKLPVRVEIARPGTTATNVTQELFIVAQTEKPRLLEKSLQEYRGSVLVFSRTKFSAKKIAAHLRAIGHASVEFHSNRSMSQRKDALEGFKNGRYRVLCATDIAARGIDVKNIELVINYDLPTVAEDYVHRIGRTGRAGGSGHAISFARPDERRDVQSIERLMRSTLSVSRMPELPPMRPGIVPAPLDRPDRQMGGGGRGGFQRGGSSHRNSSYRGGGGGNSRPSYAGSGSARPARGDAPRGTGPRTGGPNRPGGFRPRFSR